jgi:hypothetical protein
MAGVLAEALVDRIERLVRRGHGASLTAVLLVGHVLSHSIISTSPPRR